MKLCMTQSNMKIPFLAFVNQRRHPNHELCIPISSLFQPTQRKKIKYQVNRKVQQLKSVHYGSSPLRLLCLLNEPVDTHTRKSVCGGCLSCHLCRRQMSYTPSHANFPPLSLAIVDVFRLSFVVSVYCVLT